MKWDVVVRPEVGEGVTEAAAWYDGHCQGLGDKFVGEVLRAFDVLALNPLINCRRHPGKNIRWCYPRRFPYRIIYEVLESKHTVIIVAVLHGARHEQHWRKRV